MKLRRVIALVALFPLAAVGIDALSAPASRKVDRPPESRQIVLENGFEAILIPNRAAPLATSVVIVRTGSAYEDSATSGVSHMLEHLLFSGSPRRTREQIESLQARHGLINNAHTDVGYTNYFILAPREQLHVALDIQSEMLFASTLAPEAVERERGIVSNEIAKDDAGDTAPISALMGNRLFTGGPPGLPVAGTAASISAMSREAIVDWYRTWYVPNNMTAIIMGDFDPDEMEPMVRHYFGRVAPGPVFAPPLSSVNAKALGRTHTVRTATTARLLFLATPAPGIGAESYATFRALASLLDDGLREGANARLSSSGSTGSILAAASFLADHGRTGTFQVQAQLDDTVPWGAAAAALQEELSNRLTRGFFAESSIDGLLIAESASLARLWEKPHYFGMGRSASVAAAGWDYARDFVRRLSFVDGAGLRRAARPLADPAGWARFFSGPDVPADDMEAQVVVGSQPPSRAPTRESLKFVADWSGRSKGKLGEAPTPAPLGPIPASARSAPVRMVLPNGLTITIEVTDDSRVFAAHVLVKGRAAAEPTGRNGAAELLHMLAGEGTRSHPGPSLQQALADIGGTLKVTDDAQIPFDDIFLSTDYTYLRLEALDEAASPALDLLREILSEPYLPAGDDEAAFVQAKERLSARARAAMESPRESARRLVGAALWGANAAPAAPLFGIPESIAAIRAGEIRGFHQRYFHPKNLVIGINTSIPAHQALPIIERTLGRWGADWPIPPEHSAPDPNGPESGAAGLITHHADSTAKQAWIYRGRFLDSGAAGAGAARPDPAALDALAAVLSRRLSETLRETRGLAYTLGAEVLEEGGRTILLAWMGTQPATFAQARAGLGEVIATLATTPPTQEEIDEALGRLRTRILMRGLSRINRAWGRSVAELRGRSSIALPPATVLAAKVATLAAEVTGGASQAGWVEATVGPKGNAGKISPVTPAEAGVQCVSPDSQAPFC